MGAELLVGGLAQVLTSWLSGELALSETEIVEQCTDIFVGVATAP
ncbi:hypothetical protein [Qaidamihabitans albus]|nr:hypothetical protein [Qaidamihabitans albus]